MEKNPKRVEAGKKLAENNKKIKEFYIKNNSKKINYEYPIIVISVIGIGSIFYYFYNKKSEPIEPKKVEPLEPRKSKHILYE